MCSIESTFQGYYPIQKQYKCAQINKKRYILDPKSYRYELTLNCGNGLVTNYIVSGKWVERHRPEIGGYIIFIDKSEPMYLSEDKFNDIFEPCEI